MESILDRIPLHLNSLKFNSVRRPLRARVGAGLIYLRNYEFLDSCILVWALFDYIIQPYLLLISRLLSSLFLLNPRPKFPFAHKLALLRLKFSLPRILINFLVVLFTDIYEFVFFHYKCNYYKIFFFLTQ